MNTKDEKRYAWLRDCAGLDWAQLLGLSKGESLDHFIDLRLTTEVSVCTKCNATKSVAEFYQRGRGVLMAACKACQKEAATAWRAAKKAGKDTSRKNAVGKLGREDLTQQMVAAVLTYNPTTGEFTSKRTRGRIKTTEPVGTVSPAGYLRISVYGRVYTAHRLAWLLAHGQWPTDSINHKNGIKLDNRLSNLEDIPHADNTRHAHRTGLIRLPGKKSTVKLTAAQALEIRASALSVKQLMALYGVSISTVADIKAGRTWKNAEHLAAGGVVLSNGERRPGSGSKAKE